MKLGILSDIHSNIVAFKTCIEFLEKEGCEEYLFLGDYISDTPYTRETLDYIYEFKKNHICYFIRGNREEYMLEQRKVREAGQEKQMWIYNSASGNLLFAYNQLTEEDFQFFEKLPISMIYEKEGYAPITCCHGSPVLSWELLQLDSEITNKWLDQIQTDYMIGAHTHEYGEVHNKRRVYFNAGSIGVAIGDPGYSQCMILEDEIVDGHVGWKPQFLKIPYDNRKVAEDMVATGLADSAPWFANSNIQILLTGKDSSSQLVHMASELQKEMDSSIEWPLIEEKCFDIAAEKLGIPDYRKGMNSLR